MYYYYIRFVLKSFCGFSIKNFDIIIYYINGLKKKNRMSILVDGEKVFDKI